MDTRTALLDCAEATVRARGFDGFSYADLAAGVGIRKASIHHHFPAKADLALALIERYSANFFAGLDDVAVHNDRGGPRLEAFVATYRAALEGGRKLCLCIALCGGRDSLSDAVLTRLNGFHETAAAWLTDTFGLGAKDGTIVNVSDAESEAHACLAQMEGAQLVARAALDVGRFDLAVAGLLARVR